MAKASTLLLRDELTIQKNGKSMTNPKKVVKNFGRMLLSRRVALLIVHPSFLEAKLNRRDDHDDEEKNHA